jgi:hypothetical protein
MDMTPEERFWVKVDKSGGCWLWTAGKSGGYGVFLLQGKYLGAHVVSFQWAYGPIPNGLLVDHMCHTRCCVNPAHLRAVTRKQNCENRSGANPNSLSGIRGVSWNKNRGKWTASVKHLGKKINLGYFGDKYEAGRVAQEARERLFTPNPLAP